MRGPDVGRHSLHSQYIEMGGDLLYQKAIIESEVLVALDLIHATYHRVQEIRRCYTVVLHAEYRFQGMLNEEDRSSLDGDGH